MLVPAGHRRLRPGDVRAARGHGADVTGPIDDRGLPSCRVARGDLSRTLLSDGRTQSPRPADQGQDRLLRPSRGREDDEPPGPAPACRGRPARRDDLHQLRPGPHDPLRPPAPAQRRVPRLRPAAADPGRARPGHVRHHAAAGAQERGQPGLRGQLRGGPLGGEPAELPGDDPEPAGPPPRPRHHAPGVPVQQARPAPGHGHRVHGPRLERAQGGQHPRGGRARRGRARDLLRDPHAHGPGPGQALFHPGDHERPAGVAMDAAGRGQHVRHLDPRPGVGGRGRRGSRARPARLLDSREPPPRGTHGRGNARRAHGRGAGSRRSRRPRRLQPQPLRPGPRVPPRRPRPLGRHQRQHPLPRVLRPRRPLRAPPPPPGCSRSTTGGPTARQRHLPHRRLLPDRARRCAAAPRPQPRGRADDAGPQGGHAAPAHRRARGPPGGRRAGGRRPGRGSPDPMRAPRRRSSRATPRRRPSSAPPSTTCARNETARAARSRTSRPWWRPRRRSSRASPSPRPSPRALAPGRGGGSGPRHLPRARGPPPPADGGRARPRRGSAGFLARGHAPRPGGRGQRPQAPLPRGRRQPRRGSGPRPQGPAVRMRAGRARAHAPWGAGALRPLLQPGRRAARRATLAHIGSMARVLTGALELEADPRDGARRRTRPRDGPRGHGLGPQGSRTW